MDFIIACNKDKLLAKKACPFNKYPLTLHVYVVKLGYTRVCSFFFLFLIQNIECGYSLEAPRRRDTNIGSIKTIKISIFFLQMKSSIFTAEINLCSTGKFL